MVVNQQGRYSSHELKSSSLCPDSNVGWKIVVEQRESDVKKIILALVTSVVTIGAIAPAYAYENHHHECHKVKVHHHWERHCH
jgi:hypothetical protein